MRTAVKDEVEEMLMLESEGEEEFGEMEEIESDEDDEFMDIMEEMVVKKEYVWEEDPGLPEGWKIRTSESGMFQFLKSPSSDKQFNGRRQALAHMIQNGYTEEDKATMRKSMTKDGWKYNELLPEEWLFKPVAKKENLTEIGVFFISSEGAFLDSHETTVGYMQSSLIYTPEDLMKLEHFMKFILTDNQAKEISWGQENELKKEKVTQKRSEWRDDDTLPEGWKIKSVGTGAGFHRYLFLSPRGQLLSGYFQAVLNLLENGFPEEDLEKMKGHMVLNGWTRSDYLPPGWMVYNRQARREDGVILMSDEGRRFNSYLQAKEHMKLHYIQYNMIWCFSW